MGRIKFFVVLFIFSGLSIYPQYNYSVEANVGVISPINSSSGLLTSAQLNYSLNDDLQIFINASYGSWDKYNIYYNYEYYTSENPDTGPFKTFSADDHSLVSINLGSRFKLHESEIINLLFDT